METERKENPLLTEIKTHYTCLELTADTAQVPEDIGIITIGSLYGGEYVGAVREINGELFYCPRRIGGQRSAMPLRNMDDLTVFSRILREEYFSLGVTLPMSMDVIEYGYVVKDGLKDFILSYGAVSRESKEYHGYQEIVLWNMFKFSFSYLRTEKVVEIHIYRTDDKDFDASTKVDNILDGIRWIAQQLNEYATQLKEKTNDLIETIDNLSFNENGYKHAYPEKG